MPLITETYYLSLTQDNRGILRLRCSQDDTLRTVNLKLYNNGSIFTIPSGISAYVSGVKQNGAVFSKSCTISQDRESVVFQLSSDITSVDGIIVAEIVLNDGSGGRLGASNFIIQVEKNPMRAGVVQDTETPIGYVNDFITQIQALTARVNNLITPNGDPSLAEVVDARISSLDGNTYQNLKARIDADIATLNTNKANKSEVYTKSQVDNLLENVEIDVDDELSDESEKPVQNKVINRTISEIKADLDTLSDEVHSGSGMTDDIKQALFDCISHIGAWTTGEASDYINALEMAFFPHNPYIYTLTSDDLEMKRNMQSPPEYSKLDQTRLSYTKFDLLLSGGKTYRFKAKSTVNTANMGLQFFTNVTLAAVNAGRAWTDSAENYDPGWLALDVTIDVPAQQNGHDIVGVRLTFRKNKSNETISDVFISKITIEEVTK